MDVVSESMTSGRVGRVQQVVQVSLLVQDVIDLLSHLRRLMRADIAERVVTTDPPGVDVDVVNVDGIEMRSAKIVLPPGKRRRLSRSVAKRVVERTKPVVGVWLVSVGRRSWRIIEVGAGDVVARTISIAGRAAVREVISTSRITWVAIEVVRTTKVVSGSVRPTGSPIESAARR